MITSESAFRNFQYLFRSDPVAEAAPPPLSLDELHAAQGGDRVDVVKIDIEGMELAALRSAEGLLAQRPLLYLEISSEHLARHGVKPAELQALLRGRRYHFFRNVGERNSGHNGFILNALDFAFRRRIVFRPPRDPARPSSAGPGHRTRADRISAGGMLKLTPHC